MNYFSGRIQFTFLAVPVWALVCAALGNAVLEELVWRGTVLHLLLRSGTGTKLSVLVQALSFGLAHWTEGYPSGPLGALASGVFGLAQGYLSIRTRSLLIPIAIHWVVDVVIFITVF